MKAQLVRGLRALDQPALHRRFRAGVAVSVRSLADTRFRGVALGLPHIVERATWVLFAKDIVTAADGSLCGWNTRLVQPTPCTPETLAHAPLQARRAGGGRSPFFGPFFVGAKDGTATVDYRAAAQPLATALLGWAFDPLVQIDTDDQGQPVLLGVSRLSIAGWPLTTPTWFALFHEGPVPDEVRSQGLSLVKAKRR